SLRCSISPAIWAWACCSLRLIFSFSCSAASSSLVRSRIWSSSITAVWNRPKSELRALRRCSAWSIKISMIFLWRAISACSASTSAGAGDRQVSSGIAGLDIGDGDTAQGLIDMHTVELLAIGAETDGVVVAKDLPHLLLDAGLGDFQIAQHAVAGEDELQRADLGAQ